MRSLSTVIIGSLMAAVFGATGCSENGGSVMTSPAQAGPTSGPGKFVHCVFFTCKADTPQSEIDSLIADGAKLLAKIPSVRRIDCGRRDPRMQRDVNDKDYTVGLLVIFDDKAGHDLYNDHPLHKQYVEKHKDYWAGVRVFDFTAQ